MFEKQRYEVDNREARALIQHVLTTVRSELGMDFGFVSEFVNDRRVFRYVDGVLADIKPGDGGPLAEGYCHYVVEGKMPELLNNVLDHPVAAGLQATKDLPIGAHISSPIKFADGTVFGTLCCLSYKPMPSLREDHLAMVRLSASMVGRLLEAVVERSKSFKSRERAILDVISNRSLAIVYQPIYRLIDDRIVGFEALSRFAREPVRSPDQWYADADEVGLGTELEFLAVEEAVAGILKLPQPTSLSLNLSPASIASPRFQQMFERVPVDNFVIEVTEHAAIECYSSLKSVLKPFRERGLRLAIDDAGAGYSSFRHVLDLSPDLIKLDISITRNIDKDPGRRALASAITQFGREMGCEIVAEGVETEAQFETLRQIGMTKAQGYLISKPLSLEAASAIKLYRSNAGDCERVHTGRR